MIEGFTLPRYSTKKEGKIASTIVIVIIPLSCSLLCEFPLHRGEKKKKTQQVLLFLAFLTEFSFIKKRTNKL